MVGSGEKERDTIRPEFDRSIMIDFQGAKITSDTGFLLLREIDERFGILGPIESELEDTRSRVHSNHTQLQMVRQRIYQMAAGYEDCNDADFLRIDPSLGLAIGKGDETGAGQSRLSRFENEVLGTEGGLKTLEDGLKRSNDALMRRKKKQRLIVDVDSTEDPAHGKQENVAFNGHFGKTCFHPLFAFTSDGDCLRAKLRPGNVHSTYGVVDFLDPIVKRYRSRFVLFWLRGDAAFAHPQVYEYCEGERVTYFIRLPANAVLNRLIDPYLTRPVGRSPKSGIQIRLVDLRYQPKTWDRERRVIAKIEWHDGELFPRIGFIVTNSRLPAGKVVKVYNGRGDVENRIKEGEKHAPVGQDQLPPLRGQPSPVAHGSFGVQPPAHGPAILPRGRRSQTFKRMVDQAADQGRSESRVSRSEVVGACGFGVSFGPTLPCCVRVTTRGRKNG